MRNDLHFPAPYCQYAHLREALGTPSLRAECNPYACSATNNTSMQSVCLLSHQQYRSSQSHLILKYSAAPMQHSPATHSDYHGAQEEVGAHSTLPPRMIPLKISFTRRQQIMRQINTFQLPGCGWRPQGAGRFCRPIFGSGRECRVGRRPWSANQRPRYLNALDSPVSFEIATDDLKYRTCVAILRKMTLQLGPDLRERLPCWD